MSLLETQAYQAQLAQDGTALFIDVFITQHQTGGLRNQTRKTDIWSVVIQLNS